MADTDNVSKLIEEINLSMNRFLSVASVGELLVIAMFFGLLSAAFQIAGKWVFNITSPIMK